MFSHHSKVALTAQASQLGYLVHLHVVMAPIGVALGRVDHRVRHSGHTVPEQKVRERFDRLWPLLADARGIADRAPFYDDNNNRHPFDAVAGYEHGQPVTEPHWPRSALVARQLR